MCRAAKSALEADRSQAIIGSMRNHHDDIGSLAVGKLADVIVLDRDIYAVPPRALGGTEVLLTLLAGREVHRAAGFAG